MTESLLFYLISSFLFLAIIKEAMNIFFVKKEVSLLCSLVSWLVFYILETIGTNYINIPILLLFFEIISSFILCDILYSGSIRNKMLWILFLNLLGMIIESIVGYFFMMIEIGVSDTQILGSFVSKIAMLIVLHLLKIFLQERLKRDISFGYWIALLLIPLGSVFVLNTLFLLCENTKEKNASIFALLSSAMILAVNFMIFRIYEELSEKLEMRKQQIIFNKQIELCKNQIMEREESNLNIRNIKHDIENHLLCIREYIDRDEMEFARKYIEDLLNDENYFSANSSIDSGNIVVDTLLNYKNNIMRELGIKLMTHIEIPYEFAFNDADVCVILGNCLDNSIEAVRDISDQSQKFVVVEFVYRRNCLLFKICNPYRGNIKRDRHGNFLTTKKEPENHGIGLNSVKKAAKKYNGLVNISDNGNIFEVSVLLYSLGENYI